MTGDSLVRIRAILLKESRHILRDWQTLIIVIAMPLVMMFLYGYALTLDVKKAAVVIEAPVRTRDAEHIIQAVNANTYFRVVGVVESLGTTTTTLKKYQAKAAVRIPPAFGADLRDGGAPARLQVLIDGSDQNLGTILMNVVQPVLREASLELAGIDPPEPVVVHSTVLYNPQQQSALFFVPGLMAIILIMISTLLTSLTVTRENELGTMQQLIVSPVRPWEIVFGKIAPYIAIAVADGVLILVVGRIFFGVSVAGSYLFLAASSVVYIITSLSLGLIFSTIARTQQQAMMMSLPATLMPTVILSGFIFPLASMPVVLQAIAHIIPATYFLQIIRGIVLKGVGPVELWRPLAALVAQAAIFLSISIVRFRGRT
jgi:ABC-2 type transport system permease protein